VASRDPTPDFALVTLDLAVIRPADTFGRIYRQAFPDPLGYGKGRSRFSDPRRLVEANRFGVFYLGSSLKVCFLEAVLRDQRDGVVGDYLMAESELDTRNYAEIEPKAHLKLIDLTGDGPVRMGIPSDVARASNQVLARRWSLAIYQHPEHVDGILYPSRLNGETNLAVYDRAIPSVACVGAVTLRRAGGLARVLNDFRIGLV